uniref:Uncharacterized protein n=1 Tax=Oryza punctata TaxID=4537 RepID=A0A0E0LIA3_ORYPU
MESSASASLPEYVQFDGHLLPVAWLEGEVLAEFLAFLDDAAAAEEDEAEPYEVEFEEEEDPQEVEFAADDGSDDDDVVGGDLVDDGGIVEGEVDYEDDVEHFEDDGDDGSFDDLVVDLADADEPDDEAATTPAAATAENARAPRSNARMSVRPVSQFGVGNDAINDLIRKHLAEKKRRRRARRVATAMLRLRRQRRRGTAAAHRRCRRHARRRIV